MIYLDVCCLNRPFDDLEQERIKLEVEAVIIILNRCNLTEWELISSDIITLEIKQTPDLDKQKRLNQILSIANSKISFIEKIEKRAKELTTLGFKTFDALHIASAEEGNVNILLTTDDRFLRKSITYGNHLQVKLANPVQWLISIIQAEGETENEANRN
ncbi:PIN domain-containing protein [Aphanothece hegewaldii CCALA 016]|uniref:PIN domain-containing protein n=1 Tax=Aphanothece hegewaldii CCALA 016 TaxID=2107694 RepID=A0A2T1LX55_9CHRO|nr:PIN domain-containing protein [Aphanothece hegewaldii CCALA 016]